MTSDRFASALGIDPAQRQVNVEKLYLSTEKASGAYWLQLFIATGIAHFGLVLDSTAVIIGAMLVSPLMTPIVQVGMGFAIGHLHLTLRATVRLVLSIVLVAAVAALLTQLLPIHELTSEILGRTQPTFLDMIVALFCGLAASFTTARGSRDTVTAAAGTAIAIALVPPICVIGFGLGLGESDVAFGAALLFTANLAAIILVSNVFFLLTGFTRVDFERLEQRIYTEEDRARRLYRLSQAIWPPDSGHLLSLRVLLPVGFVLSVSIPLYNALQQVVWQVRVKDAAAAAVGRFERQLTAKDCQQAGGCGEVLKHSLDATTDLVTLKVTMVGEPSQRQALEQRLALALASKIGQPPKVSIEILPDSAFLQQRLDSSSRRVAEQLAALEAEKAPQACPPAPDLAAIRAQTLAETSADVFADRLANGVGEVLAWATPSPRAGQWLGWALELGPGGYRLRLDLLGDTPPAPEARTLLRDVIRKQVGVRLQAVVIRRVPRVVLDVAADALDRVHPTMVIEALEPVRSRGGLSVRFEHPPAEAGPAKALADQLRAALTPEFGEWLQVEAGDRWRVEVLPPTGRARMGTEDPP